MALTVEDGSGLAAADAYDSITNIESYLTSMGGPTATWVALSTDAAKEPHVRKATRYLDAEYGSRWKGTKTYSTQALDWPRAWVEAEGYAIDSSGSDAIPTALKQALAILADASASEDLMPDQANPGDIKRKRVKAGPVEQDVEYLSGLAQEKRYRLVENLLAPLLEPAGTLERV